MAIALVRWCLLIGICCGGWAWACPAERKIPTKEEFARLLFEAETAFSRGEKTLARAKLREAAWAVCPEKFHHKLLAASQAYDRQQWRTARARLKEATWRVEPYFWFVLGFLAQLLFSARFVVQWVASERRKQSYFPMAFWYLSLSGSSLLLVYSIWRQDPVFILGQAFNSFIYVRNLMLIFRSSRKPQTQEATQ